MIINNSTHHLNYPNELISFVLGFNFLEKFVILYYRNLVIDVLNVARPRMKQVYILITSNQSQKVEQMTWIIYRCYARNATYQNILTSG